MIRIRTMMVMMMMPTRDFDVTASPAAVNQDAHRDDVEDVDGHGCDCWHDDGDAHDDNGGGE